MNLKDDDARRIIREDTHRTLFVEAGAGSGKTTCLVDRITRLVLTDGVPMRSIAAVTFTEKAGAELRDRLRAQLEAAGGIRDTAGAAAYLHLSNALLGPGWATPATFRIGASGLYDALIAAIEGRAASAGGAY